MFLPESLCYTDEPQNLGSDDTERLTNACENHYMFREKTAFLLILREGFLFFHSIQIKPSKHVNTSHLFRHAVLRPNQSIEDSKYDTDHEKDAFHVGAFFQRKLISVASFIIDINSDFDIKRQYRLRQMATLEEYRKLGAGRAVVSFAENIIKERGFEFLWCKGRTNVQKYYESLGFEPHV